MRTAYPAIIHAEKGGGYWIEFPDLEGCFSDGDTLAEVVMNGSEALGLYLNALYEQGVEAPAPSAVDSVHPEDGFTTIIATDPVTYRRSTKSVKKTLTIPEWLNIEAEKRHINFSSVLQQALIAQID
ncbi:MAG: hypothetical protein E7317_08800 [Clostridiales bacterium]|nr:hypothetical protein [Clostridiales bacterium]